MFIFAVIVKSTRKIFFPEKKYEIVVKMNTEIFVLIFLITFDISRIIIIWMISR